MIDITTNNGNLKLKNTHENRNCEEFKIPEVIETTNDDNMVSSYNDPGTDYRYSDMEDFDPSLLCPEIIMELGETPIVINNDAVSSDFNKYNNYCSSPKPGIYLAGGGFNLTPEEDKVKKETFGPNNKVQYTKIHCTACNDHLGSALSERSNVCVHPLLNVLICKECYDFYTSGEFEKDDDGSEMYCRWCGQGGQVICCSNCEFVFCAKCIRNNLGRKKLTDIKDTDDWTCFKCDTSQLANLRVHCAEFMEYIQREALRASTLENATLFLETDYSQCCSANKTSANEVKKKKRKSSDDDDDYYPHTKQISHRSAISSTKTTVPASNVIKTLLPQKPLTTLTSKTIFPACNLIKTVLPQKPLTTCVATKTIGTVTKAISNSTTTSNVTNATFKPRTTFASCVKPTGQTVESVSTFSGIRTSTSHATTNTTKILPKVRGFTILTPASKASQNVLSSSATTNQTTYIQRTAHPNNKLNHQENEILLKTIQAGARINSNACWNFIRLRRQKATARSLEDVVAVHNKLQEVLNTMINSLTQLRKSFTEARQVTNNKHVSVQRNPPVPQTSRYKYFHNNHVSAANTSKCNVSTQAKPLENISCEYASNYGYTKTATVDDRHNTLGNFKPPYVVANLRNGVNGRKCDVTGQPKI